MCPIRPRWIAKKSKRDVTNVTLVMSWCATAGKV
jgi:hypothetical protein